MELILLIFAIVIVVAYACFSIAKRISNPNSDYNTQNSTSYEEPPVVFGRLKGTQSL